MSGGQLCYTLETVDPCYGCFHNRGLSEVNFGIGPADQSKSSPLHHALRTIHTAFGQGQLNQCAPFAALRRVLLSHEVDAR